MTVKAFHLFVIVKLFAQVMDVDSLQWSWWNANISEFMKVKLREVSKYGGIQSISLLIQSEYREIRTRITQCKGTSSGNYSRLLYIKVNWAVAKIFWANCFFAGHGVRLHTGVNRRCGKGARDFEDVLWMSNELTIRVLYMGSCKYLWL